MNRQNYLKRIDEALEVVEQKSNLKKIEGDTLLEVEDKLEEIADCFSNISEIDCNG